MNPHANIALSKTFQLYQSDGLVMSCQGLNELWDFQNFAVGYVKRSKTICGILPSFGGFVWPLLLSVCASSVVLDFSNGLRPLRGDSVGFLLLRSGSLSTPNLLRATRLATLGDNIYFINVDIILVWCGYMSIYQNKNKYEADHAETAKFSH